jgi:outer membrane murein-binding lipoprotein Lpp
MKILRLLTVAVVVVLIAVSVRLADDYVRDQASITSLNASLAAADKSFKSAAAEVKTLRAQVAQLQAQMPAPASSDQAAANAAPAAPKKSPMSQMAEMMKNPAMHDMIAAQQKQAVEMSFGDLIKHFNLSPEERDQFVKLLTDRQMDQVDIGLKAMDPSLTPDERAALGQQIKDANAADDAKIQQFLNDDADYAYYQTYVQQQPERTEISMLNTTLAKDNMPLDPTQADNLATMMYNARTNFKFTQNFGDPTAAASIDPSSMTDQAIQTYLQQEAQLQSQIADQAASLLTPEQLDIFKQNQAQMLQLAKMGMTMSRQMMGGGK